MQKILCGSSLFFDFVIFFRADFEILSYSCFV